jgi:hypothetical protein
MSTAPADLSDAEHERKAIATLQARAALAGHELVHLADGTFLISRWGLFRTLDNAAAVERWFDQVEGHRSAAG